MEQAEPEEEVEPPPHEGEESEGMKIERFDK